MNQRNFLGTVSRASAAGLAGDASAAFDNTLSDEHRVRSSSLDGDEVLENGMVQIAFSRRTGEFTAQSASSAGVVGLFEAGPVFRVNRQTLRARDADRVEIRLEHFEDAIGNGKKLIAQYEFSSPVQGFRYELCVYAGRPWVSATGYLPAGDYALGSFEVARLAKLGSPQILKTDE